MRIEITCIDGSRWVADEIDSRLSVEEAEEGLYDLAHDLKAMTHLSLNIDGLKRYFNPMHIVSVGLV